MVTLKFVYIIITLMRCVFSSIIKEYANGTSTLENIEASNNELTTKQEMMNITIHIENATTICFGDASLPCIEKKGEIPCSEHISIACNEDADTIVTGIKQIRKHSYMPLWAWVYFAILLIPLSFLLCLCPVGVLKVVCCPVICTYTFIQHSVEITTILCHNCLHHTGLSKGGSGIPLFSSQFHRNEEGNTSSESGCAANYQSFRLQELHS